MKFKRKWDEDIIDNTRTLTITVAEILILLEKGASKPYVIDDDDTPDYENSPYYAEIIFEGGHEEIFTERNGKAENLDRVLEEISKFLLVDKPREDQLEWLWAE